MKGFTDIIQLLKLKIVKDSAIVLAGNMVSAILGIITIALITRALGPAKFGIFSIGWTVMLMASQFSDLGINTALVRFVSLFLGKEKSKANLTLKVALKFKLIVAILALLIGFFISEALAVHLFRNLDLSTPLKLAFVGAFGMTLTSYIAATFQAKQSFRKFTLIKVISPVSKIIIITILFSAFKLDLFNAFTTFIIIPFIPFLIGFLIIPKDFFRAKGNEKESFKRLFNFGKWIMISTFCAVIFDRINVLMLGYFENTSIVGHYSAALNLANIIPLFTLSAATTLLPSFSRFVSPEKVRRNMQRSLKLVIPLGLILLFVFLALGKPIILFFYGRAYEPSIIVFDVIIFAFVLGLISKPFSVALYAFGKPKIVTFILFLELFFSLSFNYLLIPCYGALGAAIATASVRIVGLLLLSIYAKRKIVKGQQSYEC